MHAIAFKMKKNSIELFQLCNNFHTYTYFFYNFMIFSLFYTNFENLKCSENKTIVLDLDYLFIENINLCNL